MNFLMIFEMHFLINFHRAFRFPEQTIASPQTASRQLDFASEWILSKNSEPLGFFLDYNILQTAKNVFLFRRVDYIRDFALRRLQF